MTTTTKGTFKNLPISNYNALVKLSKNEKYDGVLDQIRYFAADDNRQGLRGILIGTLMLQDLKLAELDLNGLIEAFTTARYWSGTGTQWMVDNLAV